MSTEPHQQGGQWAPSTPACLALPGLGYRLRLPAPVPLAPLVRLPTCRPVQPAHVHQVWLFFKLNRTDKLVRKEQRITLKGCHVNFLPRARAIVRDRTPASCKSRGVWGGMGVTRSDLKNCVREDVPFLPCDHIQGLFPRPLISAAMVEGVLPWA